MAGEPLVVVDGNVAKDPKVNTTRQSGRHVTTLRVLQSPTRRRGNEWEHLDAIAFDLVCWDELADHAVASLPTGTAVTARGRLRGVDVYESRGETRATLVVDVDSIGPSLKYATASVTRRPKSPGPEGAALGEQPGWSTTEPGAGSWAPTDDSTPWGAP